MFHVTEDDLTSAIFCQCTLESTGSGTMADARQQARRMLAADKLMQALANIKRCYDRDNVTERRRSMGVLVHITCGAARHISDLLAGLKMPEPESLLAIPE